MSRVSPTRKEVRAARAAALFILASKKEDAGDYRAALRHYRAALKAGGKDVFLNIGYLYDLGRGVRPNQETALYWYRRAYRRGSSLGAHNIGTVWRDRGDFRRALQWFGRSVRMGDPESHLEIGFIYLRHFKQPEEAALHFEKVVRAERVTEGSVEQAKRLLARIRRRKK